MNREIDSRNTILTGWLVRLVENQYRSDIDFIGLTGSCATDKEDKYSDLDLVIIANDNAKKTIGECFIINWGDIEIGYDFYTMSWKRVEGMVGTTWASHIADVVPLWYADDGVKMRWVELVRRQQEIMDAPLGEAQVNTAEQHLNNAKQMLADIFITDDEKWAKNQLSGILLELTDVICVLNNTYYKYGIKDRIAEIEEMETPHEFVQLWQEAMAVQDMADIRSVAAKICGITENFWKAKKQAVMQEKRKLLCSRPETVDGWYEELVSNYKNKVKRLIEERDAETACLVSFCAQNFLEELEANTGMPMPVLYRDLDVNDLKKLETGFARVEQEVIEEYSRRGLKADIRDHRNL